MLTKKKNLIIKNIEFKLNMQKNGLNESKLKT